MLRIAWCTKELLLVEHIVDFCGKSTRLRFLAIVFTFVIVLIFLRDKMPAGMYV
jgi:hypothetical protein